MCKINSVCQKKLTLNAGLRWEHETGLEEQSDGILVGFNGSAMNPLNSPGVVQFAGNGDKVAVVILTAINGDRGLALHTP